MTTDGELLGRYAASQSEEAFAELVRRHLNLVYSAALRQVNGDAHLAEDIAQTVFRDLAGKAAALSERPVLAGWLYTSTHFTATKAVRTEQRRRAREQKAQAMHAALQDSAPGPDWEKLQPVLDEVMHQLKTSDREVILMRYFENCPLAAIGERLGVGPDTARKRIDRALEKLRTFLFRRGITLTGALATVLSANAVQSAPAGLAVTLTGASLAGAAAGTGTTLTLAKLLTMTKLQTGVVTALAVAGVAIPVLLQQQAHARLHQQDESLRQQTEQIAALQTENARLSHLAAGSFLSQEQLRDLEKLRNETASLRQQTNTLPLLREENRGLRSSLAKPRSPLQVKEQSMARMMYTRDWLVAFYQYADKHQGQFPADFEAALPFLSDEAKQRTDVNVEQFEIVFQGSPSTLVREPNNVIVVREKESWQTGPADDPRTRWAKIYGFADGHIEVRQELQNDFSSYEKEHMVSPPPGNP